MDSVLIRVYLYLVVVALLSAWCSVAHATRINIHTDFQTGSDPTCPAGYGSIAYREDTDKWRKCENGVWSDFGSGGGGGDNIQVEDGDNAGTFTAMTDANFDDSGDINFVRAAGPPDVVTGEIRSGAVGTTEAAALDAGDITTGTFADALVNGSLEENEIDLVDLADSADACAASQGVRRNAGDTSFECFTFPADDDVPEAGDFTNLSATLPITQSGGTISTSMTTSRLIGRTTAGAGVMEEITVASPLTLTGLTLDVTGIADADLASSYSGVGACGANTWASTLNDNAAPTCTQPDFTNISGTASDAQVDGSLEANEVVGTETDEALCSWEATGSLIECDLTVNAGTNLTADLEEEAHASEHQHGGADEVATATPAANAIPKAGAGGFLADAFIDGSLEENELDLLDLQDGASDACTGLEVVRRNAGDTAFECAPASGGGAPTDAEYIVSELNGTLTNEVAPTADDQIPLSSSSTAAVWVAIPNCNTENHLTYATGTNTFGCEADDGGGGGGLSYAQVAAAVMAGF